MAEKNLVNETLLQIQNLEEVINENAKEILASTMKEEISELVKESMKDETEKPEETEEEVTEADEDEFMAMDDEEESEEEDEESEDEFEMEDSEEDDEESEDEFEMDSEEDMDMDMMDYDDSDVTDLSQETDLEKVFKVFKNMKNSDTVTVVPDGDYTKISDDEEDVEYLIQSESEMGMKKQGEPEIGESDEEEFEMEEGEEVVYEIEVDEESDPDNLFSEDDLDGMFDDPKSSRLDKLDHELRAKFGDKYDKGEVFMDYPEDYEDEFEMDSDEEDMEYSEDEFEESNESYNPMMEAKNAKKGMKPKVGKGAKLGSAKKFSYKKSSGGFKETMKKTNPLKGTGKPKFEFKEGEDMSKMTKSPKGETKEASRTYGMGWRKGALKKGAQAGSKIARQDESVERELQMLRTKNEEYRKALNLFRDKLNEVAIFNSNLAYATRLFTEHSTSKQEKINILRRFDTAETLKESKALYKTIKDELSSTTKATPIKESIERVIDREPQSGSAINLIESKTYENPQFLRMKDIMSKISK